jgi:hypothetical protein
MDRNEKIKERLELALRPAEPPTLEGVLEEVSTRGVLRGPVDLVFPAWMLYIEYVTQRIIETFQLSEEERSQLLAFRDALTQLLREAWMQAKEKLTTLYKAVAEGTYKLEGKRLYAPDGTRMDVKGSFVPRVIIRGVSASAHFPDVLKLPHERLELFQLGWRASDEGKKGGHPYMGTTQPWQVFAWAAARYGELSIRVVSVNLTREGVSVLIHIKAKDWSQKWRKDEAIDLVASRLRHGEWAPLLTMWLGDGKTRRGRVLRSKYEVRISTKEPWRLSSSKSTYEALVASNREAFVKLRKAAGVYGELLDLLKAHKWVIVKLATDDALRVAFKQKMRKRSIDLLREMYRHNNEIPTEQFSQADKQRRGAVVVAGVVMRLHLINSGGGTLLAEYYTRDAEKALAVAERLESAGLRPNVVRSGPYHVAYITTTDLLRLAERDGKIRRIIALYLAEKAKNGTPRQKEIAEKILKRNPLFLSQYLSRKSARHRVSRYVLLPELPLVELILGPKSLYLFFRYLNHAA